MSLLDDTDNLEKKIKKILRRWRPEIEDFCPLFVVEPVLIVLFLWQPTPSQWDGPTTTKTSSGFI